MLDILEPKKETPLEPEEDELMPIRSSETFQDIKHRHLEGNPPKAFDGNRARTIQFLTQFKRFMLMNQKANIAKDPIAKCCYFLALFEGSKVEGWCE